MEAVRWLLAVLFASMTAIGVFFIGIGLYAAKRGAMSWRLVVSVLLIRGIMVFVGVVGIAATVFSRHVHLRWFVAVPLVVVLLGWNRFVVRDKRQE